MVVYDLKLVKMYEISTVAEGMTKKVLSKSKDWEKPHDLCEVTVVWSAEVIGTGHVIVTEQEFTYTQGDPSILGFWQHIGMKTDEVAEFVVPPALASSFTFATCA